MWYNKFYLCIFFNTFNNVNRAYKMRYISDQLGLNRGLHL